MTEDELADLVNDAAQLASIKSAFAELKLMCGRHGIDPLLPWRQWLDAVDARLDVLERRVL